ncbi:hypothetical protein ABPG77_007867 [Micractinium sp. CCAP 211/92]
MDLQPPLRKALAEGDLAGLISILDAGRDINAPLQLMPERTPLEAAASNGHLSLVAELLRRGADVRHRTTDDLDALTLAIQGGRHEVLEPLLKAGSAGLEELRVCPSLENLRIISQVEGWSEDQLATGGLTPLALAAMLDQPGCAKELLRLGARVDASCPCLGFTPVQHAMYAGSLATLRVLLDAGANLSVRDADKQTLLHLASQPRGPGCSAASSGCPHAACLRELFKRGCCLGLLDDRDAAGDTALAAACRHGHAAVVEVLLGQGADPNAGQEAPLTLACSAGCPRAVELLLDSGARYVVSRGLPSPLMAALQPEMGEEGEFVPATEQRLACARLLLKRHVATPDELSKPTCTAGRPDLQLTPLLQMATFSVCADAAKVLLDAGAAIDGLGSGPSVQLGSPLVVAVKEGNVGVARVLLERGASLQKLGPLGETVLHGAMLAGPAVLRLVLGAMQERLTREQRRQLFLAQTPAGVTPLCVGTEAGGAQDDETLQLLIAAMQLDGLRVADSTGQTVTGAGGGTSVPEPPAVAAAAADSRASVGPAAGGSSKKKKAKSRVGPALSEYAITRDNAVATVEAALAARRRAQMLLVDDSDVSVGRMAMQAMFDAAIAEDPDAVYDMFDPAWRSLSPPAQLAEGRRILALLQPSSSVQAQTAALSFLRLAVGDGSLRQLLLKAGLECALIGLLGPKQAATHPLSWHLPLSSTLSHLFVVEPEAAKRVWASAPLGGHILEFLRAEALASGGQEVPSGDGRHVTDTYLSLWSRAGGPGGQHGGRGPLVAGTGAWLMRATFQPGPTVPVHPSACCRRLQRGWSRPPAAGLAGPTPHGCWLFRRLRGWRACQTCGRRLSTSSRCRWELAAFAWAARAVTAALPPQALTCLPHPSCRGGLLPSP